MTEPDTYRARISQFMRLIRLDIGGGTLSPTEVLHRAAECTPGEIRLALLEIVRRINTLTELPELSRPTYPSLLRGAVESLADYDHRLVGQLIAHCVTESVSPVALPALALEAFKRIVHAASPTPPAPIAMRLCCEVCGELHIDEGIWATKPHHTHTCQNPRCGLTWRPAKEYTVGVRFIPGFQNTPPAEADGASGAAMGRVMQHIEAAWGPQGYMRPSSEGLGSQLTPETPAPALIPESEEKLHPYVVGQWMRHKDSRRGPPFQIGAIIGGEDLRARDGIFNIDYRSVEPWVPQPGDQVRVDNFKHSRPDFLGTLNRHITEDEYLVIEPLSGSSMRADLSCITPALQPRPILDNSKWRHKNGSIAPVTWGVNENGDLRISCVPIGHKPYYAWAESDFRASFTWVSDR